MWNVTKIGMVESFKKCRKNPEKVICNWKSESRIVVIICFDFCFCLFSFFNCTPNVEVHNDCWPHWPTWLQRLNLRPLARASCCCHSSWRPRRPQRHCSNQLHIDQEAENWACYDVTGVADHPRLTERDHWPLLKQGQRNLQGAEGGRHKERVRRPNHS